MTPIQGFTQSKTEKAKYNHTKKKFFKLRIRLTKSAIRECQIPLKRYSIYFAKELEQALNIKDLQVDVQLNTRLKLKKQYNHEKSSLN